MKTSLSSAIQKWLAIGTDRKIIFGWIFSLFVVILISTLLYLSKIELNLSSENAALSSQLHIATQNLLSSIQKLEIFCKRYTLNGSKGDSLSYFANLDSVKKNLSRLENLIKDKQRFAKYFSLIEKTIREELYKINHLSFSLKNTKPLDTQTMETIRIDEDIYKRLDNYGVLLEGEESQVTFDQVVILHSQISKSINYFFLLMTIYILILSILFAFLISDVKTRRKLAAEVSEQKEKLDVILNTAPALMFVKDIQKKFTLVNKSFLDFFNVKQEKVLSNSNEQFIRQDEQWLTSEEDDTIIEQKISLTNIEREIKLADGTSRWLNINKAPLFDENNKVIGIVGVMDDITKRIEFQNSLLKTQKQLEELNNQKNKFFSIIAHDLRGPFTGMLGFSEILLEDYSELSEKEREYYTQEIYSSLKDLLTLIDNLLTWSRLNLNRVDFNPQEISLAEICRSVFQSQSIPAANKKIELQSDINENIKAFADANMIETVIRNLASNAIKFTNTEGKIKVKAVDNKDFVKVEIEDNGVGMNPEIACNLFKIDAPVITKGTNDEKGTGLGLVICKEFVERHGGTISVKSKVGHGTVISFTLPKG